MESYNKDFMCMGNFYISLLLLHYYSWDSSTVGIRFLLISITEFACVRLSEWFVLPIDIVCVRIKQCQLEFKYT